MISSTKICVANTICYCMINTVKFHGETCHLIFIAYYSDQVTDTRNYLECLCRIATYSPEQFFKNKFFRLPFTA